MKKYRDLLLTLALVLAVPAVAQEEPEDEPTEDAFADEAPADEAAAEDPGAYSSDDGSIDTVPTEEAAEEVDTVPVDETEEAVAESDPLRLYVGVALAGTTLSASSLSSVPAGEYDSAMYRLRGGMRLLDEVSLELHYGSDASDEGAGNVATGNYFGLFVVPTANLFDWAELAFPIGYAQSSVERGSASEDLGSIAYGMNAELPLRNFGEGWPDLRLGAGWMVYYQKSDARMYGWNAGLRYDFEVGNFFADYELDLWPFGDNDE